MKLRLLALAACLALAGCGGRRDPLRHAIAAPPPPALAHSLEARYLVRCPDVVEVVVAGRPDLSGRREVGPDGCVPGVETPVAGLTAPGIAAAVAREAGLPEEAVRVRVSEHRSQSLYLVGEIAPDRQVVPYRGPETVADLLRRVGLDLGAEPADVCVVRSHVADGKPPEIFHVDLNAVLMKHDGQTNIQLEPSDQIHVGEKRAAKVADSMPPWLGPIFGAAWGVR